MPHLKTGSGISWHYEAEGEGEDLLFIHGWGVDRRIWRQQLKYFSQFYRVISVDLPGHGKSEWIKMDLQNMAEDLMEILMHVRVEKVSVVGSSIGGLLALKLYQFFPQIIKKMIFVGSMPKFAKSKDYPHGLDIERMRKLGGQLDTNYPAIINIFFRSLFTKEERKSRRFKWLQKFRQFDDLPSRPALIQYLDIMEQEDLRDVLKAIKVPVQFINGREDEICRAETVEFLKNSCPNAKLEYFEQCGHFPFLSKPYEFNETLEKFLKDTTL
ncbi:MAG TPA: alpha/beta hydrolase [Candidatus Omnitrophota bacterium]|nr:alpha/beta hydrolase [Candidatus Omnitrophota bacterium]